MKKNAIGVAKLRKTAKPRNFVLDKDNLPMTAADLAKLRPVALSKLIRFDLGLSQEKFAEVYGLSLSAIRDWEQYRSEPDKTSLSYLKVIQADPKGTAKAFKKADAA